MLTALDLNDTVRTRLRAVRALDVSPLWNEITGVLQGNVEDPDRLGEDGQPFPYMDWRTTLKDVRQLEDGRIQVTPDMNLTMHFANGVQLTEVVHRIGIGLSDPDLFEISPAESADPVEESSVASPPAAGVPRTDDWEAVEET
jgi:hypothetical protein